MTQLLTDHPNVVNAPDSRRRLAPWLRIQAVNNYRHWRSLRPFRHGEFGTEPAAPTDAHVAAANALIGALHRRLLLMTRQASESFTQAAHTEAKGDVEIALRNKERASAFVHATEQVWDFYFELFGQRQSALGEMLLGCDRVALDCYQVAFTNLGQPKSVPTPPPFCYARTGFSPATYRRGILLRKLGRRINPFPLVQLPYHRLVNPWSLGAILHEVSHNLQDDLDLKRAVPVHIGRRLLREGLPEPVVATWVRWNRETFADLTALLLGGPEVIPSLMDVLGRSVSSTLTYVPEAPHPTPFLRALISIELLRRMGFGDIADRYRELWLSLYPNPKSGTIPPILLETAGSAIPITVQAIAYDTYLQLGGKALSDVIRFDATHHAMMHEASERIAKGTDPGIVPARFLIGASRYALSRRFASPQTIATRFYSELARR